MKNKRVLITSILLSLSLIVICPKTIQAQSGSKEIGKFSLAFHPLGALTFGPMLEGEFGITDNATVGLNFRYASLGLIYSASMDFENTWGCFGFGGSFKYFFPKQNSNNRWYAGTLLQYDMGSYIEDEGGTYENEGTFSGLVILLNGGYRFRFDSGFFINLGLMAGPYISIKDEWYYTEDPYTIYEGDDAIPAAAILEVGLGIEFH